MGICQGVRKVRHYASNPALPQSEAVVLCRALSSLGAQLTFPSFGAYAQRLRRASAPPGRLRPALLGMGLQDSVESGHPRALALLEPV